MLVLILVLPILLLVLLIPLLLLLLLLLLRLPHDGLFVSVRLVANSGSVRKPFRS